MRICEANTRILRAKPQPDIDAMSIGRLTPVSTHQRIPQTAENRTLCRARALGKRYSNAEWDALSHRSSNGNCVPEYRLRMGCIFRMGCWRKVYPGIRAQNGTRFPNGGPSGKCIPEFRLKLGHTFRFTCRLKKTCAPSIPKLGRRKPKRNRRRSI